MIVIARRVKLPPGCYGLSMQDGTGYNADSRGRVEVADRHLGAIRAQYGPDGLIDAGDPQQLGTKTTRVCTVCRPSRRWNAWSERCPRCGAETIKE